MNVDARKEEFEYIEVLDKPALFTNGRVSRFTVPQGWFCYDLRGNDAGDPTTIEKYVGVNHAGTILSPTEIPFEEGSATVKVDETVDFVGVDLTLEQFCEDLNIAYPADTRKYVPRPASHSEAGLFYALKPELDEQLGGIGHLRMDFGRHGTEFWTTWHDHCSDKLNTPEFKAEIDAVVNELRESVLKDRAAMRSYCADFGGELGENLGVRQFGYVVETEHYRYCLRCKPQEGDYDGYLWCFDKRVQEMHQAQKEQEIKQINEQIRPFDVQMHALGDYYLALRFSFFDGADAGYGQAAFDSYAESKGETPVDEHGYHTRGSGYDWDEVFRYALKDVPGFEKLKFNSEAGCFFCDCADLELLKNCALTMKGIVEDQARFTELVRDALDSREQTIVGRLTFANGDVLEFTDPAEYVEKLREEIDFISTTGMKYETLTDDPQTRKAVDDIVCGLFGEDNPRPLEDYQTAPPTMQMGGLSQ